MPTNLDETELARLEELSRKASLLPWANTDTAKELLNVEPDDWWKIYASNGPEETRFPYHVVCSMSQRATEEEMTAARKAYFYPDGDHIMRDPGKSGDNARYIAAACNAVPALVAEVRRLREDRAAVAAQMGHASIQTTATTYAHVTPGGQKRAADLLPSLVQFGAEKSPHD